VVDLNLLHNDPTLKATSRPPSEALRGLSLPWLARPEPSSLAILLATVWRASAAEPYALHLHTTSRCTAARLSFCRCRYSGRIASWITDSTSSGQPTIQRPPLDRPEVLSVYQSPISCRSASPAHRPAAEADQLLASRVGRPLRNCFQAASGSTTASAGEPLQQSQRTTPAAFVMTARADIAAF
jgi:hypothetical protein